VTDTNHLATREELAGAVQQLRAEIQASADQLRSELREAVQLIEARMDRLEHKLNRITAVGGAGMFLLLLVELLVLRRVGI
jgi:type VI protein secretion system component VasF